jgi:hypothetical protein
MNSSSPRSLAALGALGLVVLTLSGCATKNIPAGRYATLLKEQGFVAFIPPQGDPGNRQDWKKYGPGAIIRTDSQSRDYDADFLIGSKGVTAAKNPQNSSPVDFLSGKTVSGSEFDGRGGWSLDAVSQIGAVVNLANTSEVEITFGKSWLSSPLPMAELRQKVSAQSKSIDSDTKLNLKRGRSVVVEGAVYTDSLRFDFKSTKSSSGGASLNLSQKEVAALNAKGFKVVSGGIEINTPRFIAYRALPDTDRLVEDSR